MICERERRTKLRGHRWNPSRNRKTTKSNESLGRPTKAVPPIVYYYCSVDTFVKIITNKTLWLTNLFFFER